MSNINHLSNRIITDVLPLLECANELSKSQTLSESQFKIILAEADLSQGDVRDIFRAAVDVRGDGKGLITKAKELPAASKEAMTKAKKLLTDIKDEAANTKVGKNISAALEAGGKQADKAKAYIDNAADKAAKAMGSKKELQPFIADIKKLGDLAKKHPTKAAFLVAALTALTTAATGGFGGPVLGLVIRGVLELAKGEKLSTALGKGLKTAALGGAIGLGASELGDILANSGLGEVLAKMTLDAMPDISLAELFDGSDYGMYDFSFENKGILNQGESLHLVLEEDEVKYLEKQFQELAEIGNGVYDDARDGSGSFSINNKNADGSVNFDQLGRYLSKLEEIKETMATYQEQSEFRLNELKDDAGIGNLDYQAYQEEIKQNQKVMQSMTTNIAALAGSYKQAQSENKSKANETGLYRMKQLAGVPLTEEPVGKYGRSTTGKAISGAKNAGTSAKGTIGRAKDSFNRNIKSKFVDKDTIEYDDLYNAWQELGSPKDTESIIDILKSNGFSDSEIKKSFSKVDIDAAEGSDSKVIALADAIRDHNMVKPILDYINQNRLDESRLNEAVSDKAIKDIFMQILANVPLSDDESVDSADLSKGNAVKADGIVYQWDGKQWMDTASQRLASPDMQDDLTRLANSGKIINSDDTSGLMIGTEKEASDGETYVWKGAAWVHRKNGQIAKKAISNELNEVNEDIGALFKDVLYLVDSVYYGREKL